MKTFTVETFTEFKIQAETRDEAYDKFRTLFINWWTDCMNQQSATGKPAEIVPSYYAKIRTGEDASRS